MQGNPKSNAKVFKERKAGRVLAKLLEIQIYSSIVKIRRQKPKKKKKELFVIVFNFKKIFFFYGDPLP